MNFFRSFRVLLVTTIMAINLCVLPYVVGKVISYVEQGYSIQFVDNARSTATLLSAQLTTLDVNHDRKKLSAYLDELIGLGHLTYAQILPDNSSPILPSKSSTGHVRFVEDLEFGEHGDNMYFTAGPFFNSSEKLVGLFQFGFDESVTQYQMENAKQKILYYTLVFFLLTTASIIFVAKKFTQPIAKIKDDALEIAEGNTEVTLNTDCKIAELSSLATSLEYMRQELVNHNKEIRSNEIYVSEIMNNMADALIIIDQDWRVYDLNWEAQKLFKCLKEEIVGEAFSMMFSEDLMQDMRLEIENNNQLDSMSFEWAGCKRRDICLYLEMKLSIVNLSSGKYIVCSARDMTIRKQTEEALMEAKATAEQASNAKSAFLSTMSHELRTPLNAIIGYSDLLLEDALPLGKPHFVQDLRNIHSAGAHLLSLINNILDLSKIEAGKMKVDITGFTVGDLLDEIMVTLGPVIDENKNVFEVNQKILDVNLETDFFKLKQILINLISNAAKFTSDGKIELDLEKIDKDFIEFSLHDTGIGISEDEVEHLFDSFTQADSSTIRQYGGTGLGLTISRKFSRLLGGDIRVESEKGKGATFFVRLPVKHPASHQDVA